MTEERYLKFQKNIESFFALLDSVEAKVDKLIELQDSRIERWRKELNSDKLYTKRKDKLSLTHGHIKKRHNILISDFKR